MAHSLGEAVNEELLEEEGSAIYSPSGEDVGKIRVATWKFRPRG